MPLKKYLASKIRNSTQGFSIVEVLIAAGLMSVLALGMVSMFASQAKEIKAIGEKLLTKELESQMKTMFVNEDYCNCVFQGKAFDTTMGNEAIAPADQLVRLKTGYSAGPPACTAAATDFVPIAGAALPNSSITISSVGFKNMTLVAPANYKGDIEVSFSNTIRAIKSIKTSVQFSINPTGGSGPTDRPFVTCSQNLTESFGGSYRTNAGCVAGNPMAAGTCACPPGYTAANMGLNDTHGWAGWVTDFSCYK